MFRTFKNILSEKEHGFTLVELIIVIIIVGILAAVGISQYSTTVEKSRLAEAKVHIGVMRQLAHEYYLTNGSLTGLTNNDVGVDNTCHPDSFYQYSVGFVNPTWLNLYAGRCASGGKTPNVSRQYVHYQRYYPGTGESFLYCYYSDNPSEGCFGMSH